MTDIMYTMPSEKDVVKVIITAEGIKSEEGPTVIRNA